jgi:diguanylate cyclase (GGDEF)-like protein
MRNRTKPPRDLLRLPLADRVDVRRRVIGVTLGVLLAALIAIVQPSMYPEMPIATMYVAPVVLMAWWGGMVPGAAGALLCAALRLIVDVTGPRVPSHPDVPVLNFGISFAFYLLICVLLVRLHRTLVFEQELARTDPLTMLGNRRFFQDVAGVELNRSRRYGRPFGLAYIDVDHFKEVNDRHGHAAGDALLLRIAAVLVAELRTSDIVTRLGGDEFAVLLPETHPDGAEIAMRKVHEKVTREIRTTYADISFSIGVVTCETGEGTLAELLATADRELYEVKKNGRGSVRVAKYCLPEEMPAVP